MHWIHFTDEDQLEKIIVRSEEKLQVIFKYSSRCHLSELMFRRLQKNCCQENIDFHFLDLIVYRNISQKVSETFHVEHESPQILLIRDGHCILEESHSEISLEDILRHVKAAA